MKKTAFKRSLKIEVLDHLDYSSKNLVWFIMTSYDKRIIYPEVQVYPVPSFLPCTELCSGTAVL